MKEITYFYELSAHVSCSFCGVRKVVSTTTEHECAGDDTDDLGGDFEGHIDEQMEDDGWADGICPECHHAHGDEIKAEREAEDRDEEDAA